MEIFKSFLGYSGLFINIFLVVVLVMGIMSPEFLDFVAVVYQSSVSVEVYEFSAEMSKAIAGVIDTIIGVVFNF